MSFVSLERELIVFVVNAIRFYEDDDDDLQGIGVVITTTITTIITSSNISSIVDTLVLNKS